LQVVTTFIRFKKKQKQKQKKGRGKKEGKKRKKIINYFCLHPADCCKVMNKVKKESAAHHGHSVRI
jgi:hypothetical protein